MSHQCTLRDKECDGCGECKEMTAFCPNCGETNYDVMYVVNHNWVAAINVVSVSIFLLGS